MLTDEPPPYDGPFNAWLLQFAQGQIAVHAGRVQEHQRQLAYHERQLRYWEQMTRTLSMGQGATSPQSLPVAPSPSSGNHSTPSSPAIRPEPPPRSETKQPPPRSRATMPPSTFRNPFVDTEAAERERAEKERADKERAEREREEQEQALRTEGLEPAHEQEAGPEIPQSEPEFDHIQSEADAAREAAEQAAREAEEAEAAAAAAREEADRALAEVEAHAAEEEARRQEAEAERERQAEAERQQAEAERERAEMAPVSEPEPEPTPTPAPVATSPTTTNVGPAPRKPPSTSPGLHADAAAVASNTALRERMARLGGLNPLAMMPGQGGMPMPRPKSKPVEEGDQPKAAAAEPEAPKRPAGDVKSTQEVKPVSPEKPAEPAKQPEPVKQPEAGKQPEPGRPIVKGPAPPPRKPGGAAPPQQAKTEPSKPVEPTKPAEPKPQATIAEAAKPAPTNTTSSSNKKYCKANFDLDNPPKGCPKFKKGDIAECVEIKGEWSHVIFMKTGEEGHVPTAYFSMDVTLPTTAPASTAPAAKKMKALFPFAPPKPKGFVPLKVGEIVTLEKGEPGEEWWVVKNAVGLSGYVPHNYVKLL